MTKQRTYMAIKSKLAIAAVSALIAGYAAAQVGTQPGVIRPGVSSYNPYPKPVPYQWNGNEVPNDAPVESRLQFLFKEDTKEVLYKRDNNIPDMVTKAYQLQNADPYELIAYIKAAVVGSRFYKGRVEALIYNDGAKFLVVTAEDYKFAKRNDGGMTIDEVVATLDLKDVLNSTGNRDGIYYPKYRSAKDLMELAAQQGLDLQGDNTELLYASGQLDYDPDMNCLFWYAGPYAEKRLMKWLDAYDRPLPELRLKYTVYELEFENDGAVGLDYQAWKNGPGRDLFQEAFMASKGWNAMDGLASGMNGIPGPSGNAASTTQFIRFSPKFNTKYVDFLTVRGYAKVMTSGEIALANRETGRVLTSTGSANIIAGTPYGNKKIVQGQVVTGMQNWVPMGTAANAASANCYALCSYARPFSQNQQTVGSSSSTGGWQRDGDLITIGGKNRQTAPDYLATCGLRAVFLNDDYGSATLQLYADDSNIISDSSFTFIEGGNPTGSHETKAYNVSIWQCQVLQRASGTTVNPVTGDVITVEGAAIRYSWVNVTSTIMAQSPWAGNTIYQDAPRLTSTNSTNFALTLYPIICQDSTAMQISAANVSLIGFQSSGAPRTQTSSIDTRVQVSNKTNRFVIGGLERFKRVRNTEQIPVLGQIPFLGSLLGRETEEIQKSNIVITIECEQLTAPDFSEILREDGVNPNVNNIAKLPKPSFDELQKRQGIPEDAGAKILKVKDDTRNIKEKGMGSMNHWGFGQWLIDPDATWFFREPYASKAETEIEQNNPNPTGP